MGTYAQFAIFAPKGNSLINLQINLNFRSITRFNRLIQKTR